MSANKASVTPAEIVASTSWLVVEVSPQATMHVRAIVRAAMRKVFAMARCLRIPSSCACDGWSR